MALLRLGRAAKKRAATAKIDHSFSNYYHLIYDYGFWEWEKDNSDYGICML